MYPRRAAPGAGLFALQRDFADPLAEQKALLQAATIYLEAGYPEKARLLLIKITGRFPENPWGFLKLAGLEAMTNDPENALLHLETALLHLETALRLGHRNLDAIAGNPDFASLRQLPAFQKVIRGGNRGIVNME